MVKDYNYERGKRTKRIKRTKYNRYERIKSTKHMRTKQKKVKVNKTNKKQFRKRSRVRRKRCISGGLNGDEIDLNQDEIDQLNYRSSEYSHRKGRRNTWLARAAGAGTIATAGAAMTFPIWGPAAAGVLGTGTLATGALGTGAVTALPAAGALKNQAQASWHKYKAKELLNKKSREQGDDEAASQKEISDSMKRRYEDSVKEVKERKLKLKEQQEKERLQRLRDETGCGSNATIEECEAWIKRRKKLNLPINATEEECLEKEQRIQNLKDASKNKRILKKLKEELKGLDNEAVRLNEIDVNWLPAGGVSWEEREKAREEYTTIKRRQAEVQEEIRQLELKLPPEKKTHHNLPRGDKAFPHRKKLRP